MEIGTKVKMVNCGEAETYPDKVWVTRSEPWEICGTMVVLLEGKTGGFDVECLKIVEEDVKMDLKKKLDERFEVFCNKGTIDEIIDKQLRSTIESTVSDIMDYDMRKDIKEQLKDVLKFDFSTYNFDPVLATVSGVVKAVLEKTLTESIAETAHKHIESIVLGEIKPEYKLSEILEDMLEGKDEGEGLTLIIDDEGCFTHLYIDDEDDDTRKYSCKYQITFYKGELSSIRIGEKDIYKHLAFEKSISGIEKALCSCYFHDSKLTLDQGTDADYYTTVKDEDY